MLVTMKEILDKAAIGNYAVAAPNVSSELNARASIEAAEDMAAPLILDVAFRATPDIEFFGAELCQLAQQTNIPVAINLDHGSCLEEVVQAIAAGFTSVMIDKSSLPYQENADYVKEIVRIAHAANVSVEAELGHVGQAFEYSAAVQDMFTDPLQAKQYITETGVDCLAVAIGTAHGAYTADVKCALDFNRLQEIKEITGQFPLVMHGSSGTADVDLQKACRMGINKVNINNDLCQAVAATMQKADLTGNKAYGVFNLVQNAFAEKLKAMIEIYGSKGKADITLASRMPRQLLRRNAE